MKWVTQERSRFDRIAGPWRISHFIDKEATFLFVPADQVRVVAERDGTVPYDISGVELGHHGERCIVRCLPRETQAHRSAAPSPRAHRAWRRHGCSTANPEPAGLYTLSTGFRGSPRMTTTTWRSSSRRATLSKPTAARWPDMRASK